jgi:hypothetical protein
MMPRQRWVRGDDPAEMLRFLHMSLTERGAKPHRARKPMLYVAALCRRHWPEMPWAYRVLVELAERKAEGELPTGLRCDIGLYADQLTGAAWAEHRHRSMGWHNAHYDPRWGDTFAPFGYVRPNDSEPHFPSVSAEWLYKLSTLLVALDRGRAASDSPHRELHSVPLLHDVGGDPYRPVKFDPRWRTSTAVAVARQMYEHREFGAMPILADALQDAGCEDAHILNHCRDTNTTHVRGCWVVDLVLGKE